MRGPPSKAEPPAAAAEGSGSGAAEPQIDCIIAQRRAAAARIAAQDRHLRICRELERLAPLTRYYRQPQGGFYYRVVEGGWAA